MLFLSDVELLREVVKGAVHAFIPSLDAGSNVLFHLIGRHRPVHEVAATAVDQPAFSGAEPPVDQPAE